MAESNESAARIDVSDLTIRYGRALAVDRVSIEVAPGRVTTMIGSNGAGKSTLLKGLIGLVPVESGEIRTDGVVATHQRPTDAVGRGLALVPEGRRLFGDLTVEENLRVGGYRLRKDPGGPPDIESVLEHFPELRPKLRVRAHHLSGGQQQMLAIGRALMSRPRLLMLDEPCSGLAPVVVNRIAGMFEEIAARGVTVLLVEQNATVALDVSDHCYVLETGRVVLDGPSDELRENEFVANAYLGV